ncbi:MAG: LuxR C-terminal-related transcriptional regulator [Pseudomonas sp.]|nr:LuxR C-terminal-related transcriptional regulator [Pseudomonas sp.]
MLDSLLRIERSQHLSQIQEAVRQVAAPLGYELFAMFSMAAVPDAIIGRVYWLEGDWFANGSAVDSATYLQRCPVTQHVLQTDMAFFWSKNTAAGEHLYRIVPAPAGIGIHGLQIPIFGRTGLEGAVSLGGSNIDSSPHTRLLLTMLGQQSFRKAKQLLEHREPELLAGLTPREQQVLQWIASGRRQSDIAAILGLSTRTVENHLRRARLRLGVATTAQAIHAAIRSGEISS